DVHIVGTGKDNQIEVALRLGEELESRGLRVLVDDRANASPGVKFKDAGLLGMPTIVVVGRGLGQGVIERRGRASGTREEIPLDGAADRIAAACAAWPPPSSPTPLAVPNAASGGQPPSCAWDGTADGDGSADGGAGRGYPGSAVGSGRSV